MSTDNQLQQKQKYLRENILEKDYDAEEFMDFCSIDKGSVDIASWTISQLKDIVRRFIDDQKSKDNSSGFNDEKVGGNFYHEEKSASNNDNPNDNMFDNWGDFVEPTKSEEKKPSVALNLVDLDFLEAMGMGSGSGSTPSNSNNNQPSKSQQATKPQPSKPTMHPNPNEDFLKKMYDQNFISAFNKSAIEGKPEVPPQQKLSASKKQIQQIKKPPTTITTSQPNLPQEQKPQRDYTLPSQNFTKDIKCRQIHKNSIQNNLICTATSHQIINPNVFVPKYVLYTITSMPNNISVKRRMKDFEQLRNLLKKMFPTTQIPHLQRYSRLSETQPHVIKKQKLYIESFLNSLLMNPILKCKILEDFLFCTDLELIKKIFREFEKMEKPKALEDLWTLDGNVHLNTNTANRKYMNQQLLYVDYIEGTFGKLKTLYDQLTLYYQNTAKIITQITTLYDELKSTTQTVNTAFPQNLRLENFESVIGATSHMQKQMSDSLQTQAKIFQSEIKHLFKYQSENVSSIRETLKNLSSIYETYEKRTDKDMANKQLYQSKKISEYKNGAEIPSKNITVLKHQSGYCQNQFKDEMKRYIKELSSKIGAKFEIFSTLQVSIAGDMDNVWRQYQQFIQSAV